MRKVFVVLVLAVLSISFSSCAFRGGNSSGGCCATGCSPSVQSSGPVLGIPGLPSN